MAVGPSAYTVQGWFNALFNNTAFSVAQVYLQLAVGDPGAAGTANQATDVRRHVVSMGAAGAPAAGVVTIANDAQLQITNLAGAQDATHYSLWDATPSGGNFVGSGLVVADLYAAGDTLTFAIGAISIALPCAA